MALGAREILLIIRARDEASRALRGVANNMRDLDRDSKRMADDYIAKGVALTSVGAGITSAGLAGLNMLNDFTNAAIDYNQEAAKTLTQTDGLSLSLEEVKKIGKDVAKVIPVPFEQVQDGLYDIFSSMDVTIPEAKKLLTEFSRASVAGQVDLQEAARGTIGILNAYHRPASDVNEVNDVMFQLVRKGVGTYKDFATTIGRAVPSAVRASQSIEDLAGMMAFLTRNGLSAAMAAASSGRALDALANPKTVQRLTHIGATMEEALGEKTAERLGFTADTMLRVTDASGKFLPVSEIMTKLGTAVKGLNPRQLAAFMQEMLKGSGGTIQARRFFDTAIKNFDELNQRTKEMRNSAGAMDEAYDIMFEQPQSQIQLLTNKYEAMKTEIGDRLLPMKMQLIETAGKLLDRWDELDNKTKDLAVRIAAFGSAGMVVVGIVVAAAGVLFLFAGAAAFLGISMGALLLILGAVGLAIAGLGVAAYLVYQNWETIRPQLEQFWEDVKVKAEEAWNGMVSAAKTAWEGLKTAWQSVVDYFRPAVEEVGTFYEDLGEAIRVVWESTIGPAVEQFKEAWDDLVGELQKTWDKFKKDLEPSLESLKDAWQQLEKSLGPLRPLLVQVAKVLGVIAASGIIVSIVAGFGALMIIARTLSEVFGELAEMIADVIATITQIVTGVIEGVSKVINGVIMAFNGLLHLDFYQVQEGILQIFRGLGTIVWEILAGLVELVWNLLSGLGETVFSFFQGFVQGIIDFFQFLYNVLVGNSIIPDMINAIVTWFLSLPGKILGVIQSMVTSVIQFFANLGMQAYAKVVAFVTSVIAKLVGLREKVVDVVGDLKDKAVAKFQQWKDAAVQKVTSLVSSVVSWFQDLRTKIGSKLSEILTNVKSKFGEIVSSAVTKIKELPGKAFSALSDLARKMMQRGQEAIRGLGGGIVVAWLAVWNWLRQLGSRIVATVGGLGGKLYGAGKALLQGLLNGLRDKFEAVKDFVRSIKDWVARNKGPISDDRRVLVPAGIAIMQGLVNGMYAGMPLLQAAVGQVNGIVAGAGTGFDWNTWKTGSQRIPMTGIGGLPEDQAGGLMGMAPGGAGGGPLIQLNVYTQEINPVKHAADLGYYVASNLGISGGGGD